MLSDPYTVLTTPMARMLPHNQSVWDRSASCTWHCLVVCRRLRMLAASRCTVVIHANQSNHVPRSNAVLVYICSVNTKKWAWQPSNPAPSPSTFFPLCQHRVHSQALKPLQLGRLVRSRFEHSSVATKVAAILSFDKTVAQSWGCVSMRRPARQTSCEV